jgi:hypothetical protein
MTGRFAFLIQEKPWPDDGLASDQLARRGWVVEYSPCRSPLVEWRNYDVVVLRSTWDYHYEPDSFLGLLRKIAASGTHLENSLSLVEWNVSKTYLRDLEERGVPIVPTVWKEKLAPDSLGALHEELEAGEIILKPVIGASAHGTYRLPRDVSPEQITEVEAFFRNTPLLAQPLARNILEEGEVSLIYIGGVFSHAVRKVPKPGDFRVQEQFGGEFTAITPEEDLLRAGGKALEALPETPLYARVDLVRANDDSGYWLMELELIEPSLYFEYGKGSAGRFAEALEGRRED